MITVLQQPPKTVFNRQDIVYVASSDNVGEIGFKYKFSIVTSYGINQTFYINPNDQDCMVMNVRDLFSNIRKIDNTHITHNVSTSLCVDDDRICDQITSVVISEAWLIDGNLTDNPGSEATISDVTNIFSGYYHPSYGFQPDPESTDPNISMVLNGNTKRAQSDRKYDTHIWLMAASFGLGTGTNVIHIPVFEEDYGLLTIASTNAYYPVSTYSKTKITLYDASGTPHTYTEAGQTTMNEAIACYPANLNANTATIGLPQPADYPNWRFYTIQFLTDTDVICGVTYAFYNAELYGQHDCKHDRVRIAWANSRGGWDYFNFIKKNEESFSMDRKRYHRIRGNYADAGVIAGFEYSGSDYGLTERGSIIQQFLSITTDWISEGEFEFLQSLLFSNQVHWVQDDGSFIPVVIEANDYVSRRERNGKLKNLDLKLRIANNVY